MTKIKVEKILFIAFILGKWVYCMGRAENYFSEKDY
jgi:hypothetical protein